MRRQANGDVPSLGAHNAATKLLQASVRVTLCQVRRNLSQHGNKQLPEALLFSQTL